MNSFLKRNLFNIVLCLLYLVIPSSVFSGKLANSSGDIIEDYLKEIDYKEGTYANVVFHLKEEARYKEAIDLLKFYLSKRRDNKLRFLLAQIYCLAGEDKKALSLFRNLDDKNLSFLKYLYLGLIYEELEDYGSAIKYYRRSLDRGDNSIALYRLAKIFYHKGKYRKAEEEFKKVIKYDPSIKLANYYLGVLYLQNKKFSLAYRYLKKANNFYPQSRIILQKLTLAERSLGKEYFLKKKKELLKRRKKIKLASYIPKGGNIPKVKVAVLREINSVGFKSSGDISLEDRFHKFSLKKDVLYTIGYSKSKIFLKEYENNKVIVELYPPVYLRTTNHPFYLLGAVYGKGKFWQTTLDLSLRGNLEIVKYRDKLNVINTINVEEYLYGVLPSEIYPKANMEALKAQAVAARTLILRNRGRHKKEGFDFCSTVHCQVYRGMAAEKERTNRAVDDTYGEVMVYKGELIEAFYHSNCGGCLRGDLFGNRGYLENKLDSEKQELSFPKENLENWFKLYPLTFCSYTKNKSNFRWQRIYDEEDFRMIFGFSLRELKGIKIVKRGECAHIEEMDVTVDGKVIRLRGDLSLRRFWDGLRSSAFTLEVKYSQKNPSFAKFLILWGAGFGHGVGMCQEGAIRIAQDGFSYKEILKHYYKDIDIEKYY